MLVIFHSSGIVTVCTRKGIWNLAKPSIMISKVSSISNRRPSISDTSIQKTKPFILGSDHDIEVIRYRSGVLQYWYSRCSILKFPFCISGPILKLPDIEDLNLRYRSTQAGNGYIVPCVDQEDLQYFKGFSTIANLFKNY